MGKSPNLDALDDLFEQACDFQLTDTLYEERTGTSLPKGKSYLKNTSALAKRAKERGFIITDIQEKPIIERTVFLKKKQKSCERGGI